MKNSIHISELSEEVYEFLSQDILNRVFKLQLKLYQVFGGPDLWQKNPEGRVEAVVEVEGAEVISDKSLDRILGKIGNEVVKLNPRKCILIYYSELKPIIQKKIRLYASSLKVDFQFYGIEWILEQLNKYPDIAKKFNIKIDEDVKTNEIADTDSPPKNNEEIEKLKKFLSSDRSYFAVGHYWGEDDQLYRFINDGIWENGHEKKIINVVNSVNEGDIVFIKSTYQQNGVGHLRIKAIGVVTQNPKDGHLLKVNWQVIDYIDLPGLGGYRNAISRINHEMVFRILEGMFEPLPEVFEIIEKLIILSTIVKQVISKKFNTVEYLDVTQSQEFYFQKAIDVLDELKSYSEEPIFLDKEDIKSKTTIQISQLPLYEQLRIRWENRGNVKPSEFIAYLKEQQAELIPLYELISKFLSYVDKNSWNYKNLNDYEDNRSIAKTGLNQTQLVDSFLGYALNNFEIVSERSGNIFSRVIEYFHSPEIIFNILSDNHRLLISRYFLHNNYTGEEFHKRLKKHLDQYGFTVSNSKNSTCFYKLIIYEITIRKLWDENYRQTRTGGSGIDTPNNNNSDDDDSENIKDKIPFHLDQVVDVDKLGREPVAKAFANLIKNDVFKKDINYSFMVHLQGEWGAGKSSFLNLIKKNLDSKDEKWIVIDYNAWQNQHIEPPWWTLIDQIYMQSKSKSKSNLNWWHRCGLRRKESFRRVFSYRGWQKILAIFLIILFIIFLKEFGSDILKFLTGKSFNLSNNKSEDNFKAIIDFVKFLGTLGAGLGVIFSFSIFISSSFFTKSPEKAVSFMNKASDPMNRIKRHFSKLVNNLNKRRKENLINKLLEKVNIKLKDRQLAIFIDDIDRCNKESIVKLLEGIQTLFKENRVLYIVAGDKNWITKSFGNTYNEFCSENESNTRLGELFVEKAFQLSFRMPNVAEDAKKEYWNYILGLPSIEDIDVEDSFEDLRKAAFKAGEALRDAVDIANPEFMKELEKSFKLSKDAISNIIIEEKNSDSDEIKHLLKDFHSILDPNPRSIKRLANNYTMSRSTLIAERKSVTADKIFRWLVIEDLFPKIKLEIKSLYTIDNIKDFFEKEIKAEKIKNDCLALLLGEGELLGEPLEIEEIKNIIGL